MTLEGPLGAPQPMAGDVDDEVAAQELGHPEAEHRARHEPGDVVERAVERAENRAGHHQRGHRQPQGRQHRVEPEQQPRRPPDAAHLGDERSHALFGEELAELGEAQQGEARRDENRQGGEAQPQLAGNAPFR